MSIRNLAAAAVLALSAGGVHAASLTFATYNIHHGAGTDDVVDLTRIAGVMAGSGAQAIAVQETDMRNERTGFVDQPGVLASEISRLTGGDWRALSVPAIDYRGGQYGNAILYDAGALVLDSFRNIPLPDPLGDGARSAGLAAFSAAGIGAFQFIGTHLTHRNQATSGGSTVQLDSLDLIEAELTGAMPAFFMGDFNAAIDPAENASPETMARLFADGWRLDSPANGTTIPDGNRVIDFVLSRGADSFQAMMAEIIRDPLTELASDHFPVVVRYDIAPVPLPASAMVLLGGLAFGGAALRRRRT